MLMQSKKKQKNEPNRVKVIASEGGYEIEKEQISFARN